MASAISAFGISLILKLSYRPHTDFSTQNNVSNNKSNLFDNTINGNKSYLTDNYS